jgi:diaminopimelate decarboxylase
MPHPDPALMRVFPRTAAVTSEGHLTVGGCDTVELAAQFGTPLYIFDEAELRQTMAAYRAAFESRYPQTTVVYASKAYLGRWLAAIVAEEGLGMDVVSGGELAVARAAGFPAERIIFHGNNKSAQELREALDAGAGRIVVDNFNDIELLGAATNGIGRRVQVLVRVSPGIDPHTHAKTTTGTVDVKFGFTLVDSQAERAVQQTMALPNVELLGIHCHLGSPIFELEPYQDATDVMIEFAAAMRERHGLELREYNIGGGFAVQYLRDKPPPAPDEYAAAVVDALRASLAKHNMPEPRLVIEPGRAIVARAGVALYTIGARKQIPGVRTYVSVDGGMGDNIRPAMYESRYEALAANRAHDAPAERVTIAGKFCESGDILIRDVELPRLAPGDLLALPASGAYNLPMASNYNMSLRPPVVLVCDGRARLVRRRETYEDLLRTEELE